MAKKGRIGTVSFGTLRPEDLIPAFMAELRRLDPDGAQELIERREEAAEADGLGEDDEYWMLDELTDALDECAPEGCYFGSNEGDGADFGFWPCGDGE